MRVLITGASGFVGRQLMQRLIAADVDTIGLALEDDIIDLELLAGAQQSLKLFAVDLRNAIQLTQVVAQIQPDKILHLAAAGVTNPAIDYQFALQHNLYGTLNLLHAAFRNPGLPGPPDQLVVIRTPGEANPSNAYTASKAAAWSFCQMYARRHGWPVIGATIFQAYGPLQPSHTFVQAALRAAVAGQDFAMTSGQQARDWIYLDDVVDGLISTLASNLPPGTTVDLGTGQSTTLLEVATLAFQLVGRGGSPSPGALPDRAGEEIHRAADVTRTAELLQWSPQVKLRDGLSLVLESLLNR